VTRVLRWARARGERGAAAVEMALVAPLLILFLIGSLQVGLVVVGNATGSNAAREGARKASIYYECADNHTSTRCPVTPSTNYNLIKNAVLAKLAGLVKTSTVTVAVECRSKSSTGAVITCEKGYVEEDTDIVVVTVTWHHIGATPFVADNAHTSIARSVINGRPDLTVLAPEPDTTPPSVISAIAYDANTDGVIDQLKLTFSEDIATTVNKSAFTLTNSVTGSNTIASATVSNRVVTLTLGGATVNTAPGAMRIALNAQSDGVVDTWGNQASFGATALTDAAAPVLTSLSDTNGLVNGFPNALDTLTLGFSEPIANAPSSTTISYTDPSTNANDSIALSGISAGPMLTNSNNYNTTGTSTGTFGGLVSTSGNNVVVTVVSPIVCNPLLCLWFGTANDSSAWTFYPSTTLADSAGNTVPATTSKTISNLF
jgi:Flp pilus assembly protein TadG